MSLKDKSASILKRLSNIARQKQVPFNMVATSFLLERLVARLTSDPVMKLKLVFKGGYVALRFYESSRYTIDLDALLYKANLRESLEHARQLAEQDIGDATWFKYENEVNLETQGEYGGIRLVFRCGIGQQLNDLRRAQILHLDIGIGDPITPSPINADLSEMLGGGDLSWQVYPIETMIAEKIHALIARGENSSRSKDIYDLSIFLPKANHDILHQALSACFDYRGTPLPRDLKAHISKIDVNLLKRGWPSAVSSIGEAPAFEVAFQELLRGLPNP